MIINRRTRALVLLLGILSIVGIFLAENYDLSFERIKKALSGLNFLRATVTTQLEPPEYSETGLTEGTLEKLFVETPVVISEPEEEELIAPLIEPESEETSEGFEEPVIISSAEKELALMKIKVKVDEISEKVQKIDKEVQKLKALAAIEKKVQEISQKVQELSQEVKKPS